jgi:hypothetical protein
MIPNESLDTLFEAVVEATEEAIINALVAAKTVEGRAGHKAWAITDPRLQAGFRQLLVGFRRKSFRDGAGIDTVR